MTPTHPDPDNIQLRELKLRIATLVADSPDMADCGIFYDYWSMPQQPRSEAETAVFAAGLQQLAQLFSTADRVLILSEGYTDYRDRSWCFFEAVTALTSTLDYSRF